MGFETNKDSTDNSTSERNVFIFMPEHKSSNICGVECYAIMHSGDNKFLKAIERSWR